MPFDGTNLTQVQRDLLAAADVIKKHGWTQHSFCSYGRVCLLGAINQAVTGTPIQTELGVPDRLRLLDAKRRVYAAIGWPASRPLFDWNDEVATSAEEVIDALLRAAMMEMTNAV